MQDVPRELVDPDTLERMCPCCGQRLLPLGLFSRSPEVLTPLPLQYMLENEELGTSLLEDEVLYACGRFFAQAELPLPIKRIDTPLRVKGWVEVDKDIFDKLDAIAEGRLNHLRTEAVLACDIPGFPGSVGSKVLIEKIHGADFSVITDCADGRLSSLSVDLEHDQMAALYRRLWGNESGVDAADSLLRRVVDSGIQKLIDRPIYRKKMTPPAGLAGIEPTEIIVAPPLDTGEEAVLATVGCSDTAASPPVELISWIRNPSDEFIRSFADFGYLSRLNNSPIRAGLIVPENPSIPGTEDKMVGWLLWSPEKLSGHDIISGPTGKKVRLLAAIPLREIEMVFAQAFGSDTLMQHLKESEVDLSDLTRSIGVPLPEEYE